MQEGFCCVCVGGGSLYKAFNVKSDQKLRGATKEGKKVKQRDNMIGVINV